MAEEKGGQAAGEKKGRKPWTLREYRGKPVWDWLDLLIVPIVLLLITVAFTVLQDARQQQLEDDRALQAQRIEDQRAEAERELAEQRAQDEALQAYLNQMSTLLLEKDLRSSTEVNATEESQEARALARARTLTVLSRLDPSRKTALMQFLVEADLVQRVEGRDPIISLRGANLLDADLSRVDLSRALMLDADLSDADLSHATLTGANLTGADLRDATLNEADLSRADLSRALLYEADLSRADLSDAFLSEAGLSYAQGITNAELDQQAAYLRGATMPNGQKYEDWIKDK